MRGLARPSKALEVKLRMRGISSDESFKGPEVGSKVISFTSLLLKKPIR